MINKNKIAILLFGAAGSGKGTQSKLLCEKFNLLHIAPGDILREGIKNKTVPEKIIKAVNKGVLVDSKDIVEIVLDKITGNALDNYKGVAFDGFPRDLSQDDLFNDFLKKSNFSIDIAILFEVSEKILLDRLGGRLYCNNCNAIYDNKTVNQNHQKACQDCKGVKFHERQDDTNIDAIKKRFKIFKNETLDVIKRYDDLGILSKIDANNSVEKIANEVFTIVENSIV